MAIDRTTFLQMCQRISILKSGIFGIKENVPDDLKVICDGIIYYPISYELSFNNGKPTHTAILQDLKANSIVNASLEMVTKYDQRERKDDDDNGSKK